MIPRGGRIFHVEGRSGVGKGFDFRQLTDRITVSELRVRRRPRSSQHITHHVQVPYLD